MSSANGSTGDLESVVYVPTISSLDEKQFLRTEADRMPKKTSRIQHAVFTLLLLSLFSVGVFGAVWNNKSLHNAVHRISPEESRFQELLNSVDPAALHDVLREKMKDKYQHGVFQEDKAAVEAIHQQNAVEAESLIELARRQATSSGNGTVVTTTAVTTTQTVVTSTESITSTADSTPSPTPTQSSSQSSTTTPSSQQSTSAPESSTTPTSQSSTITEVSTTSSSSTTAPTTPSTTPSTIASSSSESTPSSTSPTPTSQGSSTESQSESGSGTQTSPLSSRTTIYTTTIPNGSVITVTSVTVVPAGQADQTTGSPSPAATSGSASLQKGGVGRMEVGLGRLSAVVGGAAMVVMGVL